MQLHKLEATLSTERDEHSVEVKRVSTLLNEKVSCYAPDLFPRKCVIIVRINAHTDVSRFYKCKEGAS